MEKSQLLALNPALRPPVWEGRQYVPRGYRLRLPAEASSWTAESLARQLDSQDQYLNQPRTRSYRVKAGETLAMVAHKHGVSESAVAKLNGLPEGAELKARATLRLPDVPATRIAVARAVAEQRAEERVVVAQRQAAPEPVTAAEARAESPALAPGGAVARASESIDYAISAEGSIRVAAEETLGHFAQWLAVPASRLRSLNQLSATAAVPLGRVLKLDFSKTTREQFEARRREFHGALQATFFAGHRIVGTAVHVARRGDSLWMVSQRYGSLPAWLLLHYNPDVDFAALRAGQKIVIPKIEALSAA
jgi:membrane-bound lytic murein transglycosylase D